MPVQADFELNKFSDGTVTINLQPQTAVGGWNVRFQVQRNFGGSSGLITKSCASGFGGGGSGITVTNSGQGVFNVAVRSADTSGLDFGAYTYTAERLDSGNRTILSQGYLLLTPAGGA